MHEGSITIRLPSEAHGGRRLHQLVEQFGALHEVPAEALRALNLTLDEAVTNSFAYAYAASAAGPVWVRMELAAALLRSEVVDEGCAFNPLACPLPDVTAPLRERTPGGLGIFLIRQLMDQVAYRREGFRNVLTMSKRLV